MGTAGGLRPPGFNAMATETILDVKRGMTTKAVTDASDPNRLVIATEQDVTGILEYVKAKKEDTQAMRSEMRPVAEVPMAIVERAMQEGWYNDPAAWKRWLNDPDNKAFRIWEGRV